MNRIKNRIASDTFGRVALQRGVTIVESLVALIVLSVGMLGIASLYVSSLKAERTAQTRTLAVALVSDMADRIRANAPARNAYDLQKSYGGKPTLQKCVAGADTDNCSTEQLAQDDLARWLEAVKVLPAVQKADVKVELAAATGRPDNYQVLIEWREAGETTNYRYQTNLSMISVTP